MIEKMNPHYSFTTPASIYDEEALTALELAGRQGAKINEVIDDQNKLRTETEKHINDQKTFLQNETSKIENQLIPNEVADEVRRKIENGSFDASINEYAGDLEARVDNLLGKVVQGSTSSDAELIDARRTFMGTTEANAGEAIRAQGEYLMNRILSPIEPERTVFFDHSRNLFDENDPDIVLGGYVNSTGEFVEFPNVNMTGYVPVTAGKFYTSKTTVFFVNWFDEFKNYVGDSASTEFNANGYVQAPAGAYYGRFLGYKDEFNQDGNWTYFQINEGKTLGEYDRYYNKLKTKHIPLLTVTPEQTTFMIHGKNLFNPNDPDVVKRGYYNMTNAFVESDTVGQTGFIRVEGGKNYTDTYKMGFVNLYDMDKRPVGQVDSMAYHNQGYVTIPDGVYYARFIFHRDNEGYYQVEEGMESTTYEPYYVRIPAEFIAQSGTETNIRFTSYGDSITKQNQWQNNLVKKFGLMHTNLGVGSSTLAYVAEFESQYPCMCGDGRIQEIKASNPDIITILSGANDKARNVAIGAIGSKDKTTFIGAYCYLIEELLEWKPTLKIVIASPTPSAYADLHDYAAASQTVAEHYHLPYVDLYNKAGFNSLTQNALTLDGLHPNADGGKRVAGCMQGVFADLLSFM